MGVAVGDYDNDGRIDMFVTNFAYEFNNLYHNEKEFFVDATASAGLDDPSYLYVGWGTFFFDSDNDGDLDLFIANGHIMDNNELQSDQLTYEQPDHLGKKVKYFLHKCKIIMYCPLTQLKNVSFKLNILYPTSFTDS